MQAAVQHHVDAAVAKSINLPADATPADVRAIYLAAWRAGVKGITVKRYGARPVQVLTLATPEPQPGTAVQIHDAYSGGCNAHVCEFCPIRQHPGLPSPRARRDPVSRPAPLVRAERRGQR